MNKLTRAITLGGFGALAALAVGTGPAQAASSGVTPHSKSAAAHADWRLDGEVVGYYRSLRACEMAGQYGERSGAWDDHECSPVRVGLRRGSWALEVGDDDNWGPRGFGRPFQVIRSFPGQFRPSFWGEYRPGRPSHIGHNHSGPGFPGPIRGGGHGQPGPVRGGGNHGFPGPIGGGNHGWPGGGQQGGNQQGGNQQGGGPRGGNQQGGNQQGGNQQGGGPRGGNQQGGQQGGNQQGGNQQGGGPRGGNQQGGQQGGNQQGGQQGGNQQGGGPRGGNQQGGNQQGGGPRGGN